MQILNRLVDHYLFTPSREYLDNAREYGAIELFIEDIKKRQICLRYKLVKDSPWTMLNCHGNRRNMSQLEHVYKVYGEIGASYILFDYPGYGKSSGRPDETGCYDSLEAVLNWINTTLKIPTKELIIHGLSMGGAVAIEGLKRHQFRAGVIDISFTNTADMAKALFPYLPLTRFLPIKFNSLAKIKYINTPILFIAAENDRRVPAAMTQKLYDAKPGVKKLFSIPGAEHFNHATKDLELYLKNLKEFLETV